MTGNCARCGAPASVVAYFGPELCHPCAQAAADYYDRIGRWPPLPPEWQAELDRVGTPGALPTGWDHRLVEATPRPVDSAGHMPGAGPEPCPPDVHPSDDDEWMTCTVCGKGCLVSLRTPAGHQRKWPSCRMTPGCPGQHRPHHDHRQDERKAS